MTKSTYTILLFIRVYHKLYLHQHVNYVELDAKKIKILSNIFDKIDCHKNLLIYFKLRYLQIKCLCF